MDSLIFSLNAVLPIFLTIFFGKALSMIGLFDSDFSNKVTKLVFKIALPFLLFKNISQSDFSGIANPNVLKAVLFCVVSILIVFTILLFVARKTIKKPAKIGAFVQGSFRSNYVIIGIPLISNIMGEQAVLTASLVIAFILPLYNILAVVVLSIHDGERDKIDILHILKNIAKNPLIIAVLLGVVFAYFNITLPTFIMSVIVSVSGMAIPMALLSIGVFFSFKTFFANLKLTLLSAMVKIVILPIIFTSLAYFIGLREEYLLAVYVLFASPTAVSSYIMAKGMRSDADLAANIVIFSTALSLLTFFIGVFLLRSWGLV